MQNADLGPRLVLASPNPLQQQRRPACASAVVQWNLSLAGQASLLENPIFPTCSMIRLPLLRASILSRPIYLLSLLSLFALLVHLLLSSGTVPNYPSDGIDARVGWSSDAYGQDGDQEGLANKAGQALSDFGDRIGRLAGGKPPAKAKGKPAAGSGGSGNLFQRAGGSLYEVRRTCD